MILIGDERTGGNRISFGGAINSLGTTIGPLIVALALFGTSAAISDDMIKSLSLTKVIILYACVGMLFVGVAALFSMSKNLPNGKIIEDNENDKIEKSPKAMLTLLLMTLLLAICFIPVFGSYKSAPAIKIVALEHSKDSIIQLDTLFNPKLKMDAQIIQSHSNFQHEVKVLKNEIDHLKKPLEQKRLMWLSAGLLVIVGGIFFAFFRGAKQKIGWGAMQYPQLSLGMLAIFVYVGVEVAVGSNLGELLKQKAFGAHSSSQIAPYIAMFWGSLMIGRWSGAINAFELSEKVKTILKIIVPIGSFGLVLGLTWLAGYSIEALYWYIACVIVQIIAFIVTKDKPALTLSVFGILGVLAILIGINTTGTIAIYSFLSCGLFCSIMWPSIFSLSLAGLGKYQAQGSAFLVMMILGGAIIPPIQGKLSDVLGIQQSFIIGGLCFLYLTLFAFIVGRMLKKQGVSLDDNGSHAH
jgi:FHS family L-fucose permease-like MFS transporter